MNSIWDDDLRDLLRNVDIYTEKQWSNLYNNHADRATLHTETRGLQEIPVNAPRIEQGDNRERRRSFK